MFGSAVGSLALRDILQGFLPAGIAIILFYPAGWLQQTEVVVGSAIVGTYFVIPWISTAISWLYRFLPGIARAQKKIIEEKSWHQENWDWSKLFYGCLDDDERQHLFLVQAYVGLYRTTSGIFLAFSLLKILNIFGPIGCYSPLNELPLAVTIGGGLLLWLSGVAAYLKETRRLFVTEYIEWSLKYQLQGKAIVKRFWGITQPGSRIVRAVDSERLLTWADDRGRFTFDITNPASDAKYTFTLMDGNHPKQSITTTVLNPRVSFE